jgi:cytochrome c oxidase cbb3-type subunit 4
MDPGTLNTIGTVVLTAAFVALCGWAYSPSRRARFEADGRLPFHDEPADATERSES